ncbi:hypothetical protein EV702DRAFT_1197183 [Suillus placidus]|uniref:Uncharacterized protein n=1 Tax=Suillus placidus TaxID=48579 RepID=A0A9P7D3Y7_9AGAM|nr:hypothetical protein EV702DRAFT_1197183 [Suillus placidus]
MPPEPFNFFQQGSKNGQGHFHGLNPAWHSQSPGRLECTSSSKGSPPPNDGHIIFKQCSTTPATLLRSGQSATSVESVSTLEPKFHLLLKSKPPVFNTKDGLHQCIIATIWKGGKGPKHEVFSDVSKSDYHYILNAIEFDDNQIRKLSYIPRIRQIIVNLPTTHWEDNNDDEDQHNLSIPNMLIQCKTRDAEFHPLWPFEVSYSQSSEVAEAKMQLTADKNPYIEGCMHFHISEVEKYTLPSDDWAIEQELDRKKVRIGPSLPLLSTWITVKGLLQCVPNGAVHAGGADDEAKMRHAKAEIQLYTIAIQNTYEFTSSDCNTLGPNYPQPPHPEELDCYDEDIDGIGDYDDDGTDDCDNDGTDNDDFKVR